MEEEKQPSVVEYFIDTVVNAINQAEERQRIMQREMALNRINEGLNSLLSTYFTGDEVAFERARLFVDETRRMAKATFVEYTVPEEDENVITIYPEEMGTIPEEAS